MRRLGLWAAIVLAASAAGAEEFDADEPIVTTDPGELDFLPIPGFPTGSEFAVIRGDPRNEAFDMYVRLQPGTRVPLHFHSASEKAVVIQGPFPMRYEDGSVHVGMIGDFMYLQAETPHALSCPMEGEACVAWFGFDGPFDVHWVEPAPAELNPAPPAP